MDDGCGCGRVVGALRGGKWEWREEGSEGKEGREGKEGLLLLEAMEGKEGEGKGYGEAWTGREGQMKVEAEIGIGGYTARRAFM